MISKHQNSKSHKEPLRGAFHTSCEPLTGCLPQGSIKEKKGGFMKTKAQLTTMLQIIIDNSSYHIEVYAKFAEYVIAEHLGIDPNSIIIDKNPIEPGNSFKRY